MMHLQLRQSAGTNDTVATVSHVPATQTELLRLGAKASVLYTMNVNHLGLQKAPTTVDLLSWLFTHKQPSSTACKPVSTNTPMTAVTHTTRRHNLQRKEKFQTDLMSYYCYCSVFSDGLRDAHKHGTWLVPPGSDEQHRSYVQERTGPAGQSRIVNPRHKHD